MRTNRMTERDLSRIVRRVIKENEEGGNDEMAPIGKTYGEIRSNASKVNAELVNSGQGNETDAEFLDELMMLVGKYNIVGFENLVQKVKDLTSQGYRFNFRAYSNEKSI